MDEGSGTGSYNKNSLIIKAVEEGFEIPVLPLWI